MEPLRIRTLAQFRAVVESGGALVITDTVRPPTFHADPIGCGGLREEYFRTKVVENGEANGSYFAVGDADAARVRWPGLVLCASAACSDQLAATPSGGFEAPAELLAAATGGARVRPRADPPAGVEALMDGWVTTQRIAYGGEEGSGTVLAAWPGEMKAQARAVYGTKVGAAIVALADRSSVWTVRPSPHLAFNGARRGDRLYFRCPLDPATYVARWSRPEALGQIHAHPAETVRDRLWPWLCQQGFADPDDPASAAGLDHYMKALTRRRSDAHLRPGLTLERQLLATDEREMLRELTAAVAELARALGETPPAP
jgi:hypothetical protein